MILPKIALRNLTRQKRRSILLGGALSFSMFILVAVNGITGGLVANLQRNFADFVAGHIFFVQIDRSEEGRVIELIKDDAALLAAVEKTGLRYSAMSRRTVGFGSVIFGGGSISRQITGVDWDAEQSFARSLTLLAGSVDTMAGSDGIVISLSLAEAIGLLPKRTVSYAEKAILRRDLRQLWKAEGQKFDLNKRLNEQVKDIELQRKERQLELVNTIIGEEVLVQLPTMYGQQTVGEYRVAAVYETQMDVSAYVDRRGFNALMDMPEDSYNLFGLSLVDFSNLQQKTALLHRSLEDSYNLVPLDRVTGKASQTVVDTLKKEGFTEEQTIVTNLNNELGTLVAVLTGVQAGSFGLFLVILAVVMVGLVNTFRIVIYERTREIGTMRAVGMQRAQIRNLFLLEALFLSLAGILPGAVIGVLVLELIKLPNLAAIAELGFFLQNGHLQYQLAPPLFVSSVLMVVVFTITAALMPARRAARLAPAQALRAK